MPKIRFLKFTRYGEWWEYKMVPLLAVAYLTTSSLGEPLKFALPRIALLFAALVVGAIYVSVINDLTDIKEDALAGKRNSMANLRPTVRLIILSTFIVLACIFVFLIYPDVKSMIYQALSYLVFTLYSVRPIRLKKRGFWGVLCDASGAHLFPSLLLSTNILFYFGQSGNIYFTVSIGIWSLMYGLRGILWHQFFDRDNDIKSGTTTFAASLNPLQFRTAERCIMLIELFALAFMLFQVFNLYILVGILIYLLFVFSRRYILHYKIFIILSPKNSGYQLLLNDYYFVFLPLSLLLTNALKFSLGWIIILIHVMLFPSKISIVIKDIFLMFKKMFYFKKS